MTDVTYDEAVRRCQGLGMRLPTRPEVETFYQEDMHSWLCVMEWRGESFWTGSPGEFPGTHWLLHPWGTSPGAGGAKSQVPARCVRDVEPRGPAR